MNNIRVVLIEDNADEAKLTMRALKKKQFSNEIIWIKDGEEAQNYFFEKDNLIRSKKAFQPYPN